MFVSGWKSKTRKIIISSSHPLNCQCLSRKIPIEKEKKTGKKERKRYGRTQTKPNAPHVMYNVKILSIPIINNSR